jgi:hypothetical protein
LYFLRTIQDGLHGAISEIKIQYIAIPGTAVLYIMSIRQKSNFAKMAEKRFNGSGRLRATNQLQDKQYELQILKTTEEDLGVYVCEAQLDSSTTETKVILKLAGKII